MGETDGGEEAEDKSEGKVAADSTGDKGNFSTFPLCGSPQTRFQQ